jgi:hypothetical protein
VLNKAIKRQLEKSRGAMKEEGKSIANQNAIKLNFSFALA